jgi:hypothetical protein
VAGIYRLITIDKYTAIKEYSQELRVYVTTYFPILNERSLIFLIGIVVTFAIAFFALKNNQKRSAKVLGVIGNFIILY